MDWLCNMHLMDRSGQITGTREQFARLGRCTPVQVEAALQDLVSTKAADVTFRNDVVTVVNRRMKRESLARKNGAFRVQKHRGNAACNGIVAPHKSEVRSHIKPPKPPDEPPALVTPPPPKPQPAAADCEAIFQAYPRKAGKQPALKAIVKALSTTPAAVLLEKTMAYAAARAGEEERFTPHAATFFNQRRYDDDPQTWKSAPAVKGSGLLLAKPWGQSKITDCL